MPSKYIDFSGGADMADGTFIHNGLVDEHIGVASGAGDKGNFLRAFMIDDGALKGVDLADGAIFDQISAQRRDFYVPKQLDPDDLRDDYLNLMRKSDVENLGQAEEVASRLLLKRYGFSDNAANYTGQRVSFEKIAGLLESHFDKGPDAYKGNADTQKMVLDTVKRKLDIGLEHVTDFDMPTKQSSPVSRPMNRPRLSQ